MQDDWDNKETHIRVFANLWWLHRSGKPSIISATSLEVDDRDYDKPRFIMSTGPLGIIRVRVEDYEALCYQLHAWADSIQEAAETML